MPNINNISMNQQRNQRIGNLDQQKHQSTPAQHRIGINAVRRANSGFQTSTPLTLGTTFTSMMAVMTAGMVLGQVLQGAYAQPARANSGEGNNTNSTALKAPRSHSHSGAGKAIAPTTLHIPGMTPYTYRVANYTPEVRTFSRSKPIKDTQKYAVKIELQMATHTTEKATCTGSAITENTILTAAHCVSHFEQGPRVCKINDTIIDIDKVDYADNDDGLKNSTKFRAENITFTFNEFINELKCGPAYQRFFYLPPENVTVKHADERGMLHDKSYQAEKIVFHPKYYTTNGYIPTNDLALIKLQERIKGMPLVSLPTKQIDAELHEQTKANANETMIVFENNVYTQSWGEMENPNATVNATHPYVIDPDNPPYIPTTKLKEGSRTTVHFLNQLLCSGTLCSVSKEHPICSGDSGGPLLYFDADANTSYVVGVNSLGVGALGCSDGSAHANVFVNKGWIEEKMQKLGSSNSEMSLNDPKTAKNSLPKKLIKN